MAVKEILKLGNPDLVKVCSEVESLDSEETIRIIKDLDDTLRNFIESNGFGRAIAAPQIGVLKRIVFMHYPKECISGALINPKITWQSPEMIQLWDDCFSFPDILIKVERAREIVVEYMDLSGKLTSIRAKDDLSELLQHEIDHLGGILSVHRAIDENSFSLRSEWEKFWKKKSES